MIEHTTPPSTGHPSVSDHRDDYRHDDFGGFRRDLSQMMGRRRLLALIGGAGAAGLLVACGGKNSSTSSSADATSPASPATNPAASTTVASSTVTSSTSASTAVAAAGDEIPDETQGPYPADGSNGPNVLTEDGIVRSDLTTSFGSYHGTADGVPTTISLTVVDNETGLPLPAAAVYLWHCTAEGTYSIYEVADQNYLRGVQVADENGVVTFSTIFPGCYAGRWPHCHFEVYEDIDAATAGSSAMKTSQLAIPQSTCESVYGDSRYGNSTRNLSQLSLDTDNVFSDGWDDQLATATGSTDDGIELTLAVRV